MWEYNYELKHATYMKQVNAQLHLSIDSWFYHLLDLPAVNEQ